MQVNDITKILQAVPLDLLVQIYELIRSIVESDDPKRTAERAIAAAASKRASEEVLRKALG
jgi:preprotein translocase subunit Sec63